MEYWNKLELTTEPATEPVTLDELRLWLKIDDGVTTDNDLLESLIKTARKKAEDYCNRAFINQTWTLSLNASPEIINIPKGYLDSITSINIVSDLGVSTLQDSTMYQVETGESGIVFLETGNTWTTSTRPVGEMIVVFKAGYGALVTDVPEGLKTGIKQIASYLYENREAMDVPDLIMGVLNPYKVFNI